MKMQDLENQKIRIGKTSIAAIGDNGKTAGIVRNIKTWAVMSPRDTFPIWKQIKGIFAAGKCDRIILDGNTVYYVYNTRSEKMVREKPAFADLLQESITNEKTAEQLVLENGIAVIHAEILV